MKNAMIVTLLALVGLSATGSAVACAVLPPIAANACMKLCDLNPNPIVKAICQLGSNKHKA